MSVVLRVFALAAFAGALAGCQTDGLVGPEADALTAKPRVIDTPKTASRSAKPKPEPVARQVAAREAEPAQGDGDITGTIVRASARSEPAPRPSAGANVIPAQSLFGNWTLVEGNGSKTCRLILGGVLIGAAYSARSEPDCPQAFSAVQSWEIQGDELVLRNQSRGVVGRLQPTGPARFDGEAEGGLAVYIVR